MFIDYAAMRRSHKALVMLQPEPLSGDALYSYLGQYATQHKKKPWLWTVHTPMPAFKAVSAFPKERYGIASGVCIANLIIPKGATVVADPRRGEFERKMRANMAEVHSIVRVDYTFLPAETTRVAKAAAYYHSGFTYMVGYTARVRMAPGLSGAFDTTDATCAPGIHFFLNVHDALNYVTP